MLIRHDTCWLIAWLSSESKRDIRALRLQTTCKSNICFANNKHDHIMYHKYIIISTKVSVCNSLQKKLNEHGLPSQYLFSNILKNVSARYECN